MNYKELITDLVGIESYSGHESHLRAYIQAWFKERNMDAFVQGENLVLHLEGVDKTKAFIFDSHMDTVVAGDTWTHDPLKPVLSGDRLIGLGSSDMKSGLTATMLLAEKMKSTGKPPVDMWFIYVEKEEEDGTGTKRFVEWFENQGLLNQYKDMAAIFTEPNSLSEVEYGHRGNYFLIAEAKGTSGHSSRPDEAKGDFAVDKIFAFSKAFRKATRTWNKEIPDIYFKPAITGGEITSFIANARVEEYIDNEGNKKLRVVPGSVNKLPEYAIATFDLRTTPQTHDSIYEKVEKVAEAAGIKIHPLFDPSPAGFTDPSERIVKIASSTNGNRKLLVSLASADLGFVTAKGIKGIILGPGEKEQCHKPDEFCYLHQIPEAVDIYRSIVEAWV